MRVFLFGGSGYLGQHLLSHFVSKGHAVTAFTRSDSAAEFVAKRGATPRIGDVNLLEEMLPDILAHDAVVFAAQLMLEDEARVVGAMLDAYAGTNKAFLYTSGTSLMSIPTGGDWDERSFAEDDPFTPRPQIAPRLETENLVRAAAGRGVRGIVIRPPVIWGEGGSKIISDFYQSARKTGAVCYIGRGLNVYSNVHVLDLADLYEKALVRGKAGALYFAVAGEVSYGIIADRVARHLNAPTRSVTIQEGCDIWDKFMARIVLCSCSRQRNPRTREELGWAPSPDRLNILDDCVHPAYAQEGERKLPSWVRPAAPAANE